MKLFQKILLNAVLMAAFSGASLQIEAMETVNEYMNNGTAEALATNITKKTFIGEPTWRSDGYIAKFRGNLQKAVDAKYPNYTGRYSSKKVTLEEFEELFIDAKKRTDDQDRASSGRVPLSPEPTSAGAAAAPSVRVQPPSIVKYPAAQLSGIYPATPLEKLMSDLRPTTHDDSYLEENEWTEPGIVDEDEEKYPDSSPGSRERERPSQAVDKFLSQNISTEIDDYFQENKGLDSIKDENLFDLDEDDEAETVEALVRKYLEEQGISDNDSNIELISNKITNLYEAQYPLHTNEAGEEVRPKLTREQIDNLVLEAFYDEALIDTMRNNVDDEQLHDDTPESKDTTDTTEFTDNPMLSEGAKASKFDGNPDNLVEVEAALKLARYDYADFLIQSFTEKKRALGVMPSAASDMDDDEQKGDDDSASSSVEMPDPITEAALEHANLVKIEEYIMQAGLARGLRDIYAQTILENNLEGKIRIEKSLKSEVAASLKSIYKRI